MYAVADGQVIFAAPGEPTGFPGVLDGAWGHYIQIRHTNGVDSGYAHLSTIVVFPSQWVKQGQFLGLSGETGLTYGAHLHLQALLQGKRVDPSPYLQL